MMKLETFIKYDSWANNQIYIEIKKVESKDVYEEINHLFAHLLSAQLVWIQRINGEKITHEIWPDLSFHKIEHLIKSNPVKLGEVLKHPEQNVVSYKNSKGTSLQNTIEEIITHLAIHGQHHRAQIATLLRKSGIAPPATDFIFFMRNRD